MQAAEGTAAKRPESAAASGRTLLNLRVRDAEGGLLGRTLLTLVSNKARGLRACLQSSHHGLPLYRTVDNLGCAMPRGLLGRMQLMLVSHSVW